MMFEEFHAGQQLVCGPATITEAEIVAFASAYDPQWFHTDPVRAAEGRWRGLIASGWHTCAIGMRLVVDGVLRGSESFGSPGLDYVKWLAPVRPGDVLTMHADVLEVRRSERNSALGILRWQWRLVNQAEVAVLDLVATSLFDLASRGADMRGKAASMTAAPR